MDTMVIKISAFLFFILIFDLLFYTTNILYSKVLFFIYHLSLVCLPVS
jgi:hypothetical protein